MRNQFEGEKSRRTACGDLARVSAVGPSVGMEDGRRVNVGIRRFVGGRRALRGRRGGTGGSVGGRTVSRSLGGLGCRSLLSSGNRVGPFTVSGLRGRREMRTCCGSTRGLCRTCRHTKVFGMALGGIARYINRSSVRELGRTGLTVRREGLVIRGLTGVSG